MEQNLTNDLLIALNSEKSYVIERATKIAARELVRGHLDTPHLVLDTILDVFPKISNTFVSAILRVDLEIYASEINSFYELLASGEITFKRLSLMVSLFDFFAKENAQQREEFILDNAKHILETAEKNGELAKDFTFFCNELIKKIGDNLLFGTLYNLADYADLGIVLRDDNGDFVKYCKSPKANIFAAIEIIKITNFENAERRLSDIAAVCKEDELIVRECHKVAYQKITDKYWRHNFDDGAKPRDQYLLETLSNNKIFDASFRATLLFDMLTDPTAAIANDLTIQAVKNILPWVDKDDKETIQIIIHILHLVADCVPHYKELLATVKLVSKRIAPNEASKDFIKLVNHFVNYGSNDLLDIFYLGLLFCPDFENHLNIMPNFSAINKNELAVLLDEFCYFRWLDDKQSALLGRFINTALSTGALTWMHCNWLAILDECYHFRLEENVAFQKIKSDCEAIKRVQRM